MANKNTPHGFRFAYTTHGGPPAIENFVCGSCTEVFQGDIVWIGSSTGVEPKSTGSGWDDAIANDDQKVVGVAGAYSKSGSQTTIPVYTDLQNTIFQVQVISTSLAFASSNVGSLFDTTWIAGSTITGLSGAQLTATTATAQSGRGIRYLGPVLDANFSTSGGYQKVYVTICPPGGGLYQAGATS